MLRKSLSRDSRLTLLSGKLGTAVLKGLLASTSSDDEKHIYQFFVCVASIESHQRLQLELYKNRQKITFFVQENIRGVTAAQVVILGCKPYQYREILTEPGMTRALQGKTLLSMLGGVSSTQLEASLGRHPRSLEDCSILRTIPNMAACVCRSLTLIERGEDNVKQDAQNMAVDLFSRVGRVKAIPSEQFEVGVVLSASTPAFFAAVSGAMLDSETLQHLDREIATGLIAASMWSTSHLLFNGCSPQEICQLVATPKGSTARGLHVLADSGVEQTFARALGETSDAAGVLGYGQR